MLMYFNVWYSLLWLPSDLSLFIYQAAKSDLSDILLVFVAIAYALWLLAEPFRLYLGYAGNLYEKVPHLSAFTLLTVFPQLAAMILLFVTNLIGDDMRSYHFASQLLMLFFLVPELLLAVWQLRLMIKSQTFTFYHRWRVHAAGITAVIEMDEVSTKR
eukprot:TRINITY_DN3949_c1_g1_i3.p1 TRINITY_DN3949_c1_g1~~TRINITY_DN3949_c1_g1_i3.p1  ORF type:complete len:158 (+),score=54.83 TRINITY_DN3949_c1_g1_i3:97-570(+)